eukprot:scaffold17_cov354-Pavlova_lutheri.AAC.59
MALWLEGLLKKQMSNRLGVHTKDTPHPLLLEALGLFTAAMPLLIASIDAHASDGTKHHVIVRGAVNKNSIKTFINALWYLPDIVLLLGNVAFHKNIIMTSHWAYPQLFGNRTYQSTIPSGRWLQKSKVALERLGCGQTVLLKPSMPQSARYVRLACLEASNWCGRFSMRSHFWARLHTKSRLLVKRGHNGDQLS